jgi:lysophospholipase L1-like esterase
MAKATSICVFGDSTAWGAFDLEKGGWAERLWFELVTRTGSDYIEFYNLSIDGGTTETILRRFEHEAKIRRADALIFCSGGNDSFTRKPDGPNEIPLRCFRKNLMKIIRKARRITDKIVFIGPENCDEAKTTPVSWGEIYYTNKNIRQYRKEMERVCEKMEIDFVDPGEFPAEDFYDGLHPNAAGHQKIYRKIKEILIARGWI